MLVCVVFLIFLNTGSDADKKAMIYVDGDIEINDIALTVSGGQSIEADNISITTNKAIAIYASPIIGTKKLVTLTILLPPPTRQ